MDVVINSKSIDNINYKKKLFQTCSWIEYIAYILYFMCLWLSLKKKNYIEYECKKRTIYMYVNSTLKRLAEWTFKKYLERVQSPKTQFFSMGHSVILLVHHPGDNQCFLGMLLCTCLGYQITFIG